MRLTLGNKVGIQDCIFGRLTRRAGAEQAVSILFSVRHIPHRTCEQLSRAESDLGRRGLSIS